MGVAHLRSGLVDRSNFWMLSAPTWELLKEWCEHWQRWWGWRAWLLFCCCDRPTDGTVQGVVRSVKGQW